MKLPFTAFITRAFAYRLNPLRLYSASIKRYALKIGIIVGSPRNNSESSRIAQYLENQLSKKNVETYLLDLKQNPLPLWDESIYKPGSDFNSLWQPFSQNLQKCEGFIVITPEWGGMATPGIKNFFLLCGNSELSHKPGLIVSVSAGISGAYPISELRSSSYKNTQLVYTPDHIIIRFAKDLFLKNENLSKDETALRKRIDYSLDIFKEYVSALNNVRESGKLDLKTYPFGM